MAKTSHRARFQIQRSMTFALLLLFNLPLRASEAPRVFPLWDGKETVAAYAARVNLPATKSVDLEGGVALDLVLIPAGQFIMGSAEPEKPTVTPAQANILIGLGGAVACALLGVLLLNNVLKSRRSFSLRWLLLMMIAAGVFVGGIARRSLALKEAARYETLMAAYNDLPAYEKPAHSVTLTKPFYMGKYTVTQEQYTAVIGTNPSVFTGAQLPVESISWDNAASFCTKLNGVMRDKSLKAQLPTEAEWEYACRAGTRTRFYSGDADSDLDKVGWYAANSGNTPHPVGQKKPNAFGLYDMHGNVWQWCEDLYDITGSERVIRGGCWFSIGQYCRAAYRYRYVPAERFYDLGFRLARVPSGG